MLRTLFVLILVTIGTYYILQGPFYALLFYIGNAYFRPEEWVYSDLVRRLNLSFLSGIVVLLMTILSRQRFIMNGRIALLLIFLGHTFLSMFLSAHHDYCWPWWKDFLKANIITYLMIVLVTDFSRFRLVVLVMVFALALEAKQGWYYLLYPPNWGGGNPNPVPFLGDNNGVAVGMLMLVPVINFLGQTTSRPWGKRFYQLLLVGALFRAISTFSRGGFMACISLGIVYVFRSRQKVRGLIGMGVLLIIVLAALPDSFWMRMNTITTYEEDSSATGRLHFWHVATLMAHANPIFGVGFNGYNPSYDSYDDSPGDYGTGRSVHSSYFGILAELGYVGLILYLAILFQAFRSCHRVRKLSIKGIVPMEFGLVATALEASLTAFVIGGVFLPFQYSEMLWHFIGLTIVLRQLASRHVGQGRRGNVPETKAGTPVYSSISSAGSVS